MSLTVASSGRKLNQQAANLLWYRNKKDEGIIFDKFFSLFPMPALALVYTAAKCCIDEWSDGKRVDISFSSGDYREVYDKHLANLKKFDTRTKDHGILAGILTELNNNGRYSGSKKCPNVYAFSGNWRIASQHLSII
ncbi:hypothetical protein F4604DRAFT_1603108 [Suillus subluteus]|nr:hypothetical protein F4604DRAFT_1603108 [Suillus subluteus]